MNASNKARLGFYTTVFLEGENEEEAEERAIALLRDNQEFASSILNEDGLPNDVGRRDRRVGILSNLIRAMSRR